MEQEKLRNLLQNLMQKYKNDWLNIRDNLIKKIMND